MRPTQRYPGRFARTAPSRRAVLCALLAAACAPAGPSSRATPPDAAPDAPTLVRAALEAMGGEDRLRAIEGIRLEGIGSRNLLEQSERFEGPWIPSFIQFSELRDHRRGRVRRTAAQRDYNFPEFRESVEIVADGAASMTFGERMVPGASRRPAEVAATLALAPERILLTALDATDLHAGGDTTFQGVPHHTVDFRHGDAAVRVLLNAHTGLPSAVETTRAYTEDFFWDVWGDVTRRTLYSTWDLLPGGIRYPLQWDEEWDGLPYRRSFITAVDLRAAATDDSFAIPPQIRAAMEQNRGLERGPKTVELGQRAWSARGPKTPVQELGDGVILVPGGYNVLLVRQADGVVVVEAPFSSEYTARILGEVDRRFPDLPVKAVVSTGDAWTYIGGIRDYVARGIPVYALDLNRPILERLLHARHTIDPDSLEREPRRPTFRWVDGATVVGDGPNRIELHPVRGEGGERMVLAYLPDHRILWASDLIQALPDGSFFWPQFLTEVADVVRRERLAVDTVLAMHHLPIPWARVVEAIDRVRSTPPPATALR